MTWRVGRRRRARRRARRAMRRRRPRRRPCAASGRAAAVPPVRGRRRQLGPRSWLAPTHQVGREVGAVGEPGEGGLDVAQVTFDRSRSTGVDASPVGSLRSGRSRRRAGARSPDRIAVIDRRSEVVLRHDPRPAPNRVSRDVRRAAADAALGRVPTRDGDARTVGDHPRRLRRVPARSGDVPRSAALRQLRRQLRVERPRPVRRPVPQHRVPERTRASPSSSRCITLPLGVIFGVGLAVLADKYLHGIGVVPCRLLLDGGHVGRRGQPDVALPAPTLDRCAGQHRRVQQHLPGR